MIYVIQAENGMVKIGCSKHPATRIASIQFNSPLQLRLIAILDGNGADERRLHSRFDQSRRHNEWFAPDREVVLFLADVWGKGLSDGVVEWITDFSSIRETKREATRRRLSEVAKKSWARSDVDRPASSEAA